MAIRVSSDINKIDEYLRKKVKTKKTSFTVAGILAIVTFLIVLWPKGHITPVVLPIDSFDSKEGISGKSVQSDDSKKDSASSIEQENENSGSKEEIEKNEQTYEEKKDGNKATDSKVQPTANNVGLKIDRVTKESSSHNGKVYIYEYTAKEERVTFELLNGHTARWGVTADITAADRSINKDMFAIAIKPGRSGVVTANIEGFDIVLQIKVKRN